MNKAYFVQVNDTMTPVKVELAESDIAAVIYVLKEIAKGDKDALVSIEDEEDGKVLYSNYEEWIETHK